MKDIEPGICCYCTGLTITGIFTRADENTLPCKGRHDQSEWHLWARVELAGPKPPKTTVTGTL